MKMQKQHVFRASWVAAASMVLLSMSAQAQFGGPGGPDPNAKDAPTPRLANGKPDLTGSWRTVSGAPEGASTGMFRRCSPFQSESCMEWTNQSIDWAFMASSRYDMNKPLYRPEHWDKVQALDMWTNRDDPVMTCLPLGLPRQGPPSRIFHTDNDMTMIYRGGVDGAGGYVELRMVRHDKTEHNENDQYAYSYFGVPTVRWEGDTMVLESVGFSDETWFGRGGYFHTANMRATERFTRTGNEMVYEVTIEDPEVLAEPWVLTPRVMQLSGNDTVIAERGSCTDTEHDQVSSQYRH
jgi:hypothetical protein